ncbi:MAG TPA: hypothetical protein VGM90_16105 [Kofleriaceae bacterium]
MRTRQLGDTTATAVGAGDVSLAIAASRGVDRSDTERALTAALSSGLTFVDVHPGEADAERLAAEVIRSLRGRDRITLAVTIPTLNGRDTPIDQLPPRYIQAAVEAALRTTKLDALPLVQLPLRPNWPSSKAWPELVGTAARLVREGKVLSWGIRLEDADTSVVTETARDPDDDTEEESPITHLAPLLAETWFISLSVVFNACMGTAGALIDATLAPIPYGPLAPAPAASGFAGSSLILSPFAITETAPAPLTKAPGSARQLAILARQPLAGRALAGTLGPGVKLSLRDDRQLDPATLDRLALSVARLARLVRTTPPAATSTQAGRDIVVNGKRPEHVSAFTLAELALRYVIDRGAIALPRLHRHEHVPETLMAGTAEPLTPDIVEILDGIS